MAPAPAATFGRPRAARARIMWLLLLAAALPMAAGAPAARRMPTYDECREALRRLNFNVLDYKRYPHFFRNDSFIHLAQAGIYKSPTDIEEYVLFADPQGSPYLDGNYVQTKPRCKKNKLLKPTEEGLCQLGVYSMTEYNLNPTMANGTLRTLVSSLVFVDPVDNKVPAWHVYFPRSFLENFFTMLATPQVRSYICDTLEKCPDAWKKSGLDTMPRGTCEDRLAVLPVAETDMLYIDGNSFGCRLLHAVFATKNSKHCPHISLEPMMDVKGKTKCSISAGTQLNALFGQEFLDGILDHADEMGMPFIPRTADAPKGGSEFWLPTDVHSRVASEKKTDDPSTAKSAEPPSWSTHALDRHVLDAYPRARCNNGRPAAYYSDAAAGAGGSKRRAVIYFEGGGVCYNSSQCMTRLLSPSIAGPLGPPKHSFNAYMMGVDDGVPGAMTSDAWPLRLGVSGVLSNKALHNPTMHDWLHVVIPYCTSDFHIGDHCGIATNAVTDAVFSGVDQILHRNKTLTATGYCGAHVVDAVLDHLLETHPAIRNMEQVVLFGSSAGGIAAAVHADAWAASLPGADVRAVVDSSWFPATSRTFATKNAVQESGESEQLVEYARLANAINASQRVSTTCVAEQSATLSLHAPLATSDDSAPPALSDVAVGACLLLENILPHLATPAWVVQGLYDVYSVNPMTGRVDPNYLKNDVFLNSLVLLNWFESYGPSTIEALESAALRRENAHHRIFAPSCIMHGMTYHDGRSLKKVLKHDKDGPDWSSKLTIINPSDTCETIDVPGVGSDFPWLSEDPLTALRTLHINGTSAYDHMTGVLATPREELRKSTLSRHGILFADICRGLSCNPSCSAVLKFPSSSFGSRGFSGFEGGVSRIFVNALVVLVVGGMAALDLAFIVQSFVRLRQWADSRRRLEGSESPASPMVTELVFEPRKSEDDVHLEIQDIEVGDKSPPSGGNLRKTFTRKQTRRVDVRALRLQRTLTSRVEKLTSRLGSSIFDLTKRKADHATSLAELRIPFELGIFQLTYQVLKKETKKLVTILDAVTLRFHGKGMTAVMGASGCGKSTLLELIVGQRMEGIVSGMLLRGGQPAFAGGSERNVLDEFGYVPQHDDASTPTLTGREVLMYCLEMRMPELTRDETVARVEEVIASMGIQSFADTAIGMPGGGRGIRGISGGQRRRLTLASQLLHDPTYLMADEPTSGLDSSSALSICGTLLKIAQEGHAIVLTIHQPRPEVFELFTRLVVMGKASPGRGGTCLFAGSVAASISHFRRLVPTTAASMGATVNPADFIIDVISNSGEELQETFRRANDGGRKSLFSVMLHNLLHVIDRRADAENMSLERIEEHSLLGVVREYKTSHSLTTVAVYTESFEDRVSRMTSDQPSDDKKGRSLDKLEKGISLDTLLTQSLSRIKSLRKSFSRGIKEASRTMSAGSAMEVQRMLSQSLAMTADPVTAFVIVQRWFKVTAAAHGRMYLSDLAKGPGSYMTTNYLLYVVIVIVVSIVYWQSPESPSGMYDQMTAIVLVTMMPQFGKVTTVEGMGNMVLMHRRSRMAGNEHGSHFAIAYALTQSFTPWFILGTVTLVCAVAINIPMSVVPALMFAAVTVDAIVSAATATIVSSVGFEVKTAFAAAYAGIHGIGSGVIFAYDDLPPIFKWIAWVMPAGPCLSLVTTQFVLAYDGFVCPEEDPDRSGIVDGYCNLANGASVLSALTMQNPQLKWVSEHVTETIAILLCQYLFWRIALVAINMYKSSRKSEILAEPFDKAIVRLINETVAMGLDINEEVQKHYAATMIQDFCMLIVVRQKCKELGLPASLISSLRNELRLLQFGDKTERMEAFILLDNDIEVVRQVLHDRFAKAVRGAPSPAA